MAGNIVRVGDVVAFAARTKSYGKGETRIGFGRVVRLTGASVAVVEASYCEPKDKPPYWALSLIDKCIRSHKSLLITMASLPKEVFMLFDNMTIDKNGWNVE
jgi:hypothetical protein